VSELLADAPELALARLGVGGSRHGGDEYFLDEIDHLVYAGDTTLHIAAAAHEPGAAGEFVNAGAIVAAANRRGAQPLHYAVDGIPRCARWNPAALEDTVRCLIELRRTRTLSTRTGRRHYTVPCAIDAQRPSRRCSTWAQILRPPTDADPRPCSSRGGRPDAEEAGHLTRGHNNRDPPTPASVWRRVTFPPRAQHRTPCASPTARHWSIASPVEQVSAPLIRHLVFASRKHGCSVGGGHSQKLWRPRDRGQVGRWGTLQHVRGSRRSVVMTK
jgi:hypothetical protein